ncbi:hypothetical protein L0B53_01600 [Vibrio sp. SS-MA-C1-2]|uniref:hypothetical protein n=1 Tax=Vibrio sp. SS-MA-C1-2 TaxID=2908646 RepID=UPI001F22BAED|nr:hypothetical protein [Vibrio sp. SS-MA-C1-2]UJF17490.1 hypothetical protein L0B53_01600 [Vibrio sp. SS-MA-C1-2]
MTNNDVMFSQRLAMITKWQPENGRESQAMQTLLTSCLNNKLGVKEKEHNNLHVHHHRNSHY